MCISSLSLSPAPLLLLLLLPLHPQNCISLLSNFDRRRVVCLRLLAVLILLPYGMRQLFLSEGIAFCYRSHRLLNCLLISAGWQGRACIAYLAGASSTKEIWGSWGTCCVALSDCVLGVLHFFFSICHFIFSSFAIRSFLYYINKLLISHHKLFIYHLFNNIFQRLFICFFSVFSFHLPLVYSW